MYPTVVLSGVHPRRILSGRAPSASFIACPPPDGTTYTALPEVKATMLPSGETWGGLLGARSLSFVSPDPSGDTRDTPPALAKYMWPGGAATGVKPRAGGKGTSVSWGTADRLSGLVEPGVAVGTSGGGVGTSQLARNRTERTRSNATGRNRRMLKYSTCRGLA